MEKRHEAGKELLEMLMSWDYNYEAESKAATFFQLWWWYSYSRLWKNQFSLAPSGMLPTQERTMQILLNHADSLKDVEGSIATAYRSAADSFGKLSEKGMAEWYKAKNTSLNHLGKLAPFSVQGVKNGGWGNTVNAVKSNHGPSWRMVVEMTNEPEGFGIYAGGQSGNPGSRYYSTFVDKWANGKYNKLTFIGRGKIAGKELVKYHWTINPE